MFGFFKRHYVLSAILIIILVLCGFLGKRSIGPYRSYRADIQKPQKGDSSPAPAPQLLVGVAEVDITPDLTLYDTWTDADNDGRFNPKKGDSFQDKNGNGKFDSVWMAGFSSNRPPKGVHDPLLAQAIAFRNNGTTVVMVTIDSIGILAEKFIAVRKMLDPSLGIDHVMFSSTHNHESPDTLGIWSYSVNPFDLYFDYGYIELLKSKLKTVVEESVHKLQPCDAILAETKIGPDGFMDDSRKPLVYDNVLRCARFVKPGTEDTIATMIEWGNHVETLASGNSLLTADFVHYIREGVEKGVTDPNGALGLGGTCLFFQGQVGGLMTQLHTTVPHRNGTDVYKDASFDKAQALGENIAIEAMKALRGPNAIRPTNTKVAVAAKSVFIPMEGPFEIACFLGLIHPGWYWGTGKSEIDVIRVGDLEILTIPGELYPEIAYGGIERPEGADFNIEPVEVPPLLSQMKGKLNMIVGLANDEIGYIIPKSQWDTKPPYAYGETKEPQYGEENSCGPDVAGTIHRESMALLKQMHTALGLN
jgi:hypothetical protein